MLKDDFKFSVAIGLIYAVVMIGGLSIIHWNEPDKIVSTK
jgi:hypothetical protein